MIQMFKTIGLLKNTKLYIQTELERVLEQADVFKGFGKRSFSNIIDELIVKTNKVVM